MGGGGNKTNGYKKKELKHTKYKTEASGKKL